MTTVINTPPNRETADGGGWAVSVILLVVVIGIGLLFWINYRNGPTAETQNPTDTSANINVTLPSTDTEAPKTTDTE